MPKKFAILEVDSEGKVINSWHGRDGALGEAGEDFLLGASEGAQRKKWYLMGTHSAGIGGGGAGSI